MSFIHGTYILVWRSSLQTNICKKIASSPTLWTKTKQDMFKCDWEFFQLYGQRRPEVLMTKGYIHMELRTESRPCRRNSWYQGPIRGRGSSVCQKSQEKPGVPWAQWARGRVVTIRIEKWAEPRSCRATVGHVRNLYSKEKGMTLGEGEVFQWGSGVPWIMF